MQWSGTARMLRPGPVVCPGLAAAGVGLGDGLEVLVSLIPQRETCACPRRAARSMATAARMSEATGRRRTRALSLVTWATLGCTR